MPNSSYSSEGEAWPTLTVNSRLARWRLLEYNEAQHQSGQKAWSTPQILPLTAWLQQVWMQSWPEQYILTPLQAEKLWAKIVRKTSWQLKLDLLHLRATSKKAAEAYSLIQQYRLPVERENFSQTEEGKLFYVWMHTYQQWLETHNAVDPASVLDAVHTAMSKGLIALPKGIIFAGFEEITPQFKAWLDFLKKKFVPIEFHPKIADDQKLPLIALAEGLNIEVREYNNKTEETIQCSRWVRANHRPGKKFGIVVPDMQSYRSLLNRELAAELSPISVFPWVEKEQPFNISLGTPLAEEPMISIALQMLSAQKTSIPLRVFVSVIKSPFFISGQNESSLAHELENKLLKNNIVTVYLSNVDSYFNANDSKHLVGLMQKWKLFIENRNEKKMPAHWSKDFADFFHSLDWPKADKKLTGKEIQIYESWKECLDKLASLDTILGDLNLRQAVETLTGIVQKHSFQEKTSEASIQAVGLLESSGMQFDHLWVMGCHAEVLPALPSPNPFLPVEMRKQYNLPHSTAQRELEFAQNSLRRLIASSSNIVFSYPAMDKNTELKISPLLLPFKEFFKENPDELTIPDSHRLKDQIFLNEPLQVFEETVVLPSTQAEKTLYSLKGPGGGTRLIKDQAECPFRSFANHRLHTQTVEFPELDFDSRERGILVHQTLEYFWKEIRSLSSLLELASQNRLIQKIEDATQKALKQHQSRLLKQPRFNQLEKERIVELIRQWLDMEMERSEFKVIHQEEKISLIISGIRLGLRIDRIDKTGDGKIFLIDYKTGEIKPGDWFTDRIKEPQLPLYAFQQSPSAILFGQVKKGGHQLKGAVNPRVEDPGLSSIDLEKMDGYVDWDKQLQDWRYKLTALADKFLKGQTEVDPLDGATTCRNCGLQTLCRIQEMDTVIFDGEEE